ncbi:MAG: hypothetical protein VB089_21345 [Anaerolineaceae bacterium]|nr:hypothetical protein [Anaerolineaceae bacterium]
MEQKTPLNIRFTEAEYRQYKEMADELGLPFSTFVKLVLRQTAEVVFDRMHPSNMTIDVNLADKSH